MMKRVVIHHAQHVPSRGGVNLSTVKRPSRLNYLERGKDAHVQGRERRLGLSPAPASRYARFVTNPNADSR
jgi:hypothetical protein